MSFDGSISGKIHSMIPTDDFRKNYDRVFGDRDRVVDEDVDAEEHEHEEAIAQ